jgi:hypothetical protein
MNDNNLIHKQVLKSKSCNQIWINMNNYVIINDDKNDCGFGDDDDNQ